MSNMPTKSIQPGILIECSVDPRIIIPEPELVDQTILSVFGLDSFSPILRQHLSLPRYKLDTGDGN